MKRLGTLFMLSLMASLTFAQFEEKKIEGQITKIDKIQSTTLSITLPAPENQDETRTSSFDPQDKRLTLSSFVEAQNRPHILQQSTWGTPSWIKGSIKEFGTRSFQDSEEAALAYLNANNDILPFTDIQSELRVLTVEHDNDHNMSHVKIQQSIHDIDIFGGEVWVHLKAGNPASMTGRLYPSSIAKPKQILTSEEAFEIVKSKFSDSWLSESPILDGYNVSQYKGKLVWYPLEDSKKLQLAYIADVYPDFITKQFIAINAETGVVIDQYLNMCYFHHDGEACTGGHSGNQIKSSTSTDKKSTDVVHKQMSLNNFTMGDETATAPDLFGINRTFHVILEGGTYFMVDISKPMYNASASSLPANPVGGIRTYDGLNNPFNASFTYSHITSSSNNWTDRASVSAHYNASQAYEYFRTTFNRNSINGSGSTITSYIHVTNEDDQPMDNAFWNGEAMFYGDGNQGFFSLARGLDVAGHEISHGVVQNTANLNYQNESGALNESFADIFGSMIDRDDWLIGEDVVKTNIFTSGALRSMMDPTQGLSPGANGYQPGHYDTRYIGPNNRGGVHINSGIPNRAFYLFATAIGKNKAEQVYYRALSTYLTRSSDFSDCRAAVMQAAQDLYGSNECNAAALAFDQVGIDGSDCGSGGPVIPVDTLEIAANPGADLILYVDDNTDRLKLIDGTGAVLVDPFTTETPISKPSTTDDGSRIVFVNNLNQLYIIEIDWTASTFNDFVLQSDQIWRNVAISKDGTLAAATTSDPQNSITVFHLESGNGQIFPLSNPTSGGVSTGEVLYSDAMEFDYSGRHILYDAVNEVSGNTENIQYWDIGIIRVWDRGLNDFGDGQISKLFAGLPEGISIGNPTLSKTKPNVLAYDVLEEGFFSNKNFLFASNIETNTTAQIYENNAVSYPSYSRTDDRILFNSTDSYNGNVVGQRALMDDRITPTDDATLFLDEAYWATWFANGFRNTNVGTRENLIDEWVSISPNPASDILTINLGVNAGAPESLTLYNTNGKSILVQHLFQSQSNFNIPIQHIPSGSYLVELNTSKGRSIKNIIIQH